MGNERIIAFRTDNLSEALIQEIIIPLGPPFVLLGSLNPRDRLGGFFALFLGLLLRSSLGAAFITFESIQTIKSHILREIIYIKETEYIGFSRLFLYLPIRPYFRYF